jgi:glycosyltransferase involved in cell wall biosynthesis
LDIPPKLIHVITGLNDGGAEAILYQLSKRLSGFEQIVISLKGSGKYAPMLEKEGIRVYGLKGFGLLKIFSIIRKEKPDIIQTWMYHANLLGGIAGKLGGVKKIFWGIHNSTLIPGKSKSSTILVSKISAKLSNWLPTKIAIVSQEAMAVHTKAGYNKDKLVYIPNGYDVDEFKPNPEYRILFRKEFNLAEDHLVIGAVGRYDPQKDYDNLIKALEILKKQGIKFTGALVGNGLSKSNQNLETLIYQSNLQDDTILLGKRMDIPKVMNGMDILVLSSAFGEAFPNVVCEAMACGTPCVVTDVGDSAEIVDKTGWVVPPQNPVLLSNAIGKAIADYRGNKTIARKRIVDNYSIDKMMEAYQDLWKN